MFIGTKQQVSFGTSVIVVMSYCFHPTVWLGTGEVIVSGGEGGEGEEEGCTAPCRWNIASFVLILVCRGQVHGKY